MLSTKLVTVLSSVVCIHVSFYCCDIFPILQKANGNNINQRSLSDLYTIITIDVIERIRRVTVHNDTHNRKVPTSDPYEKRQKREKLITYLIPCTVRILKILANGKEQSSM